MALLAATTWLLGVAEPFAEPVLALTWAVPISLIVVVLGYLVVRQLTAGVAIRRSAG